MENANHKSFLPEVVVFAGPNGSGKSTITGVIRPLLRPVDITYINADEIKKVLHCTDLEAAQLAEKQREECLAKHVPFCFETVLSTERNLNLLRRAKENGFFLRSFFVLTSSADVNVARVKGRVQEGGHDVPEEKIRSRYDRSLANVRALVDISDVCNIYDNTLKYPMRFFNKKRTSYFFEETPLWSFDAIKDLTGISAMENKALNHDDIFAKLDIKS